MEGIGRNGPYIPHTTLFFSGTLRGNLFLSRNLVLDANGSSVVILSPLAARIPSVTASVLELFTHKDLFFFSHGHAHTIRSPRGSLATSIRLDVCQVELLFLRRTEVLVWETPGAHVSFVDSLSLRTVIRVSGVRAEATHVPALMFAAHKHTHRQAEKYTF